MVGSASRGGHGSSFRAQFHLQWEALHAIEKDRIFQQWYDLYQIPACGICNQNHPGNTPQDCRVNAHILDYGQLGSPGHRLDF
jgi:hypothetical protein